MARRSLPSLPRLSELASRPVAEVARFDLDALAGRLCELRAGRDGAALTCAFGLVHEAQTRGEPAAYVGGLDSSFYPPDVADGGIDLAAVVVVRAAEHVARARAAEELVRSGAFAVVLVDLTDSTHVASLRRPLPPALLSRLLGLAQKHASALVFLDPLDGDVAQASPIGSLVSLRVVARHRPHDESRARYTVTLEAVKDKRRAPGWHIDEVCRAPIGMAALDS